MVGTYSMYITMEFRKAIKTSRFMDPMQGFQEIRRSSQVRYDPLTGHTTRILDFPVKQMEKADLEGLVSRSKQEFCPFCPDIIHQVTPEFSPDLLKKKRYARGEALCVPNVFPCDENAAVTVMSRQHYLPLDRFTTRIIQDAIICCIDYLGDVFERQPDVVYQSINWNYMPLAGGSIIHPHLQITASSTPTNYYTDALFHLENYYADHSSDFWLDLIAEEKKQGQRFIVSSDTMSWVVAFAPMGVFDIIGIMPSVSSPRDMQDTCMDDLTEGIMNILGFIDSLNMYSLNMSIFFLLDNGIFTPHLRICPRVSIPPLDTSQINYMGMLHNENVTIMSPEDVCSAIKKEWKGNR